MGDKKATLIKDEYIQDIREAFKKLPSGDYEAKHSLYQKGTRGPQLLLREGKIIQDKRYKILQEDLKNSPPESYLIQKESKEE